MSQLNDGAALPTLGPIQLIPPGLMGLLQLKQLGRLPGELSQKVVGVIELRDWYMQARRINELTLFGTGTPQTITLVTGNIGFQFFALKVPAGQLWWVEHMTVHAPLLAAADTITYCCVINDSGTGSFEQVGVPYVDVVTARLRDTSAFNSRGGFWAGPLDSFAIWVMDIAVAVNITLTLRLRATVLPL